MMLSLAKSRSKFTHSLIESPLISSIFSQNSDGDDWNGFEVGETTAKPSEHAKSHKSSANVKSHSVEDFTSLDVKATKVSAKPKDDKENDLWDMLNE